MKRLVLAALLITTAACQNAHTRQQATPQFMRVGPVPESDVSGKCGLSLKARSRPFPSRDAIVFFQETGEADALIALDGESHALLQTRASRDTLNGFPSLQAFEARGMTARLSLRPARADEQEVTGSHIGVLMVNKTDGWSTTIPVSGTIACK